MPIEQMIVTEREGGRGVNRAHGNGYQLAARSPGLNDKTCGLIRDLCVPLAASLRIEDATRQEDDWRKTLPRGADPRSCPHPPEILRAFPLIWSYWQIENDMYVLAQVRYLGWCRSDQRPNNFLAHALVFSPRDLAPCGYNPLALSRAKLMQTTDDGVTTELPVIPQFPAVPTLAKNTSLLTKSPYREQAAALISCLAGQADSSPPLLLCMADWDQGPQLIEALLDLLPPPARCRTAFRSFAGHGPSARPQKILVAWKEDISSLNLNPSSYQANTSYQVFNFVEGKYLSVQPGRYASFVTAEMQKPQSDRLDQHHRLARILELSEPADWDRLIAVTELDACGVGRETVREAMQFLAKLAANPATTTEVLKFVEPHLRRLVQERNTEQLRAVSGDVATMANAAVSLPDPASARNFIGQIRTLAREALAGEQVLTASALLDACGEARKDVLVEVLREQLTPTCKLQTPPDEENRGQLVDLLLEALRLAGVPSPKSAPAQPSPAPPPPAAGGPSPSTSAAAGRTEEPPLPYGPLLVALFRAASAVSRVPGVWKDVADKHVKPFFGDGMDPVHKETLKELARLVPEQSCPQGSLWLNIALLKAGDAQGEDLYRSLERIAVAASQASDPGTLKEVLPWLQGRLQEEDQVLAIGRMADKTSGDSPIGEQLYSQYRDQLAQIAKPQQQQEIRRDLATAGAANVLCREFLEQVLPWRDEHQESATRLQFWTDAILKNSPAVLNAVREEVARRLQQQHDLDSMLLLVLGLLRPPSNPQDASPGFLSLYQALIQVLPIEPPSKEVAPILAAPPAGIDSRIKARVEVINFLREVEGHASKPGWSVVQFPSDSPVWQAVGQLDGQDKEAAIHWCVDTLNSSGIATPQEAESLWKMLSAAKTKSPKDVTEAAYRLLKDRDGVTAVQFAMAFAQHVIGNSAQAGSWADMFAELVKSFDPADRKLLQKHLDRRFCVHSAAYDQGIERLCSRARLPLPKWLSETAPLPPPKLGGRAQSQPRENSEGIVGFAVGFFKRLFQKSRGPKQPGASQNPAPEPRIPTKPLDKSKPNQRRDRKR